METFSIGNGIKINVIKTDKFKTITICALLRRPLCRSEATVNALLPNILRRGSKNCASISGINARLESMYGAIFDAQIVKKGEEQILQFYIEVVRTGGEDARQTLYDAFDFLCEIITNPLVENDGFHEKYTYGEIENLKNIINGRINNKTEYAKLRCLEEMCVNEPFGIYADGYAEDLDGLTPQNIYGHYKKILAESPFDFIVIGDVDGVPLDEIVRERFSLERSELIKLMPADTVFDKKDASRKNEDLGSAQGKLCMGLRSGISPTGPELYHLLAAGEILGGGPSSRLFTNVREKESLCYYINSFVYRFKTILFIQSGVEKDNFDKVLQLIEKEIDAVKSGNISEDELQTAKKSLTKRLRGIKDHPSATMDFYITQYMLGDGGTVESAIEAIERSSLDDVWKAAGNLFIDTIYTLS